MQTEAIRVAWKNVNNTKSIKFHGTFLTSVLKQNKKQATKIVNPNDAQYIHLFALKKFSTSIILNNQQNVYIN